METLVTVGTGLGTSARAKTVVERWQMPRPLSLVVLWNHADRSGPWCTAVVTGIGAGSLDVMIMPNGLFIPQPMSGCKHESDPSLASMARDTPNPGGIWRFSEADVAIQDLRRRLQEVRADLGVAEHDPAE